jgi:hypothetical protein
MTDGEAILDRTASALPTIVRLYDAWKRRDGGWEGGGDGRMKKNK